MKKVLFVFVVILTTAALFPREADELFLLHKAIQDDNSQLAFSLIREGYNVNEKDKDGFTPLMYAIAMNNEEIIDTLIKTNANVNERDKSGLTVLMHSSAAGNPKVLGKLLAAGAELEAENEGWTALTTACKAGKTISATDLIERGANINIKTKDGWSPFLFACANCNDSLIDIFIEKGADIIEKSHNNWTPLMASLSGGNLKSANYFLDNGVDINAVNDEKWSTFLYACKNGDDDIINKFIAKGADIHFRGPEKQTPLMMAISAGNLNAAKLLVNKGVDLKKPSIGGWFVMSYAARYGDVDLVRLLHSKGLGVNTCTNLTYTALMLAAVSKDTEKVKYLLEQNANTKVKTADNKWDAFLFACHYGDCEMVQLFLDRGEKIKKFREGGDPILRAVEAGNTEVVKLLIDNGAVFLPFHMRTAFENDYDEIGKIFMKLGIEPKKITNAIILRGKSWAVSYAAGKSYMYAAEMNEAAGNKLLAQQQFSLAAANFDKAIPDLLKQAEISRTGRKGLLFSILKLGLTTIDIADTKKGRYVGYGELIPTGAGEVSPNEAKGIEYEHKAEYSRKMMAYCSEKIKQ